MNGDEVIDLLNTLWTNKRALIDQYVARSKVRAKRGDPELAERFSEFAFGQMREVSGLLDRIVELDGIPELQPVDPVPVGATVEEQLEHSQAAEEAVHPHVERARSAAAARGDDETVILLTRAADEGNARLEWLRATRARGIANKV